MADEVQVDVVVDDTDLAGAVLQTEAALLSALQAGQLLKQQFAGMAQALLPAQQMVAGLRGELQALNRQLSDNRSRLRGLEANEGQDMSADEAARLARSIASARQTIAAKEIQQQRISSQLASADETYRNSSMVVRQARSEAQIEAQARQIAREELLKTRTSDGRTLGEAQESAWALRAAVTGMNTTPAQVNAQLREAATKAAERLITTTADALTARLRAAEVRTLNQIEDFGSDATVFARLNRAGINREKLLRDFGPGTALSLSEREAASQAEKLAKEQAAEARKNDQYLLGLKQRHFAEMQAAEAAAAKADASEADRNRKYLLGLKQRHFAEVQAAEEKAEREQRALKEAHDRRILGMQQRYFAQEQRTAEQLANPDYIAGLTRKDARFLTQYGVTRDAAREALSTLGPDEAGRKAYLANLEAEQKARRERERAELAAAGKAPPMTPEERIAAAWRGRNDMVDSNGGADMFAMQAKVASNYMIFGAAVGAIRGSITAIAEFDDVMARFQAITGTANSEMKGFREQLLGVAKDSRFSVAELGQVAITLGQTGLSASDVAKALKPVADLAAASGSTLQQSVEAITSVLGAYGLEAGRAVEVSDVLVGALNSTKLTMEQLQLGIQYSANIARDSGISFSELAATVGAVSQAGVKSGSTIGTGVRQLITELTSPTEKLRGVLKELGISLSDVDLRANGLSGVLTNLQKSGFTTADALRSLDLRAAAAFAAIAGQGPLIEQLRQEMLLASASSEAAGKANESLSATMQRLQNTTFALVDSAFKPLVEALKAGGDGLSAVLKNFQLLGPLLPAIGVGLSAIAASMALMKVGPLAAGLLPMLVNPVGVGIGAAAGAAYLASTLLDFETALEKVEKRLDALKGVENELSSKRDTAVLAVTDIDRQIEGLILRRDKLNNEPLQLQNAIIEAQKGFGDLGFSMDGVGKSADGLIQAYQRLRGELANKLPDIGTQQILANQEKLLALKLKEREEARQAQAYDEFDGSESAAIAESFGFTTGGRRVDPLERYRRLGPVFNRAMDTVANPGQIDPLDRLGSTKLLRSEMLAEQASIFESLLAEQMKPEAEQNKVRLKDLTERYKLAGEALERFSRTADRATQIQAAETETKRLNDQREANRIEARPETQAFRTAAEALAAQRQSDQQAVLAAKGLDGKTRIEQMMATLRVTSDQAKGQLADLDAYENSLVDGGANRELVKVGLEKVRGQLQLIAKSASKELVEMVEGLKPEAVLETQAERRANDAQLTSLTRTAQTTNSQKVLEATSAQMEDLIRRNGDLSKELLTLGKTPEQIEADLNLKGRVAELDRETQAKLEKLATDVAERRRKLEEDVLRITSGADKAREQDLRAEAARLEKIAKDARTTPEKARELVEEINRLLDEAKNIALRRNAQEIQREGLSAPAGPLPNGQTAPVGSVAQQIITNARSLGDEGRLPYYLTLAQLESSMGKDMNFDNNKIAKGLYQFIPSTWETVAKGRDRASLVDQQYAIKGLTSSNAESFERRFGRQASDAELFVLHNQGSLDLLDPRNAGRRATDFVRSSAIEENGARGRSGDITAGEFAQILKDMFDRVRANSPRYTTTSEELLKDKQAAGDRKIQEDDAKERAQINGIPGVKENQAELARLKVADKAAAAEIAQAAMQIAKATEAESVGKASAQATSAYGTLARDALREDGLDARSASRTDAEKAEAAEKIADRFRDLAEKEALAAADAAGKVTVKVYDQEIDRVQKRLEVLRLDKNENKASQAEIDQLDQQLVKMKEKRALEGEYQSVRAQIQQLETSIAQITQAGLGPSEKQVTLNQQLLKLKERMALIEPQLQLKSKIDSTNPTMENAISGGIIDFQKSRGILDATGGLVDETRQARKLITSELAVIGSGFDNLWTNLFSGSMKAGDALKKFATDVLGGLMSNLSKSLTNSLFAGLFGDGTKTGGGLLSELFGGIVGKANGGFIRAANGFGVANRDSVPAMLMPGEFVLRKSAVDAIGKDKLEEVNALGGQVVSRAPKVEPGQIGGSASANANVYVVAPDQAPIPGPDDIVHAIADNMQKKGTITKLVKAVTAGRL